MAQTTMKVDSDIHSATVRICTLGGKWLMQYVTEALQEKNERELPEILKKLQEKQENREAFTAYVKSMLDYNVQKAIKERDDFVSLHQLVYKAS